MKEQWEHQLIENVTTLPDYFFVIKSIRYLWRIIDNKCFYICDKFFLKIKRSDYCRIKHAQLAL